MGTGLFITGTDTGVGKTRAGILLARQLRDRGYRVRVRKPVESGCQTVADQLLPADAEALRQAAGSIEPLERICPYPLAAPVAPPRAATLMGRTLHLAQLTSACHAGVEPGDVVLVEGAGGFLSPLAVDALNADLAVALALPVLLVATDRLGAIHQVLATAEAIQHRGQRLAAVLLSATHQAPDPLLDNAGDLSAWLNVPILSLPHLEDGPGGYRFPEDWLDDLLNAGP